MPTVKIIPGEARRFHVVSRSGQPDRLVDLDEFEGNGWCGCENFEFDCMPYLVRGAFPSPVLECWHIKQAKAFEKAVSKLRAAQDKLRQGKV